MLLNTKHRSRRRSIGQWCSDIWTTIDRWIRTIVKFIYNRNRGEILGRTGQRWSTNKFSSVCPDVWSIYHLGKLAAFYLFFYLALSGFFLICLSIFMCFLPLNRPRFVTKASRLTSRSNQLTPGSFHKTLHIHTCDEDNSCLRTCISSADQFRFNRSTNVDHFI